MPCWTRTQTQITLGPKTDVKLLIEALKAMGQTPTAHAGGIYFAQGSYTTATGQLTLSASGSRADDLANQIKRAYGAQVAQRTAILAGWQVKTVTPFKFEVTKGGV